MTEFDRRYPATVMVWTDSAKATSGFDLEVWESNGLRLRWVDVKIIVQTPVMISLTARLDRWLFELQVLKNLHLYTTESVISVLTEGYNSTLILNVRNESNNIYYWWNEQNKKEKAEEPDQNIVTTFILHESSYRSTFKTTVSLFWG